MNSIKAISFKIPLSTFSGKQVTKTLWSGEAT